MAKKLFESTAKFERRQRVLGLRNTKKKPRRKNGKAKIL